MRYCTNCGRQVDETMNFCPACGAAVIKEDASTQQEAQGGQRTENTTGQAQYTSYGPEQYTQQTYQQESYTSNYTQHTQHSKPKVKEPGGDIFLAILSYLGILVFVPVLAGSKSEFVRHHANQGLVLFICEVVWGILDWLLSHFVWFVNVGIITIGDLLSLMNLVFFVLAIIGIVYACKSEKKELPFIGNIILFK